MINRASQVHGGIYMYSNLKGNDGGRLYFDGASCISMNGLVYAQAPQFSIDNIEIEMATVDLNEVRIYRNMMNSRPTLAS